ncbi:MAG: hypothetical protein V1834_00925 [Candidatus Micrarchaeota archaeon]
MDTTALMALPGKRIDVKRLAQEKFEEKIEFVIPTACANELKAKKRARAKTILEYFNAETVETKAIKPDEAVMEAALKEKAFVLTNDAALKRRLKNKGVRVLTITKKNQLA